MLIILIISSPGEIYNQLKELQLKYLKLHEDIKYFFVEFKDDIDEDIIIDNYDIYIKGTESINPGMIIKTCKAIEWINNNFEYDFLLRTNLSTFLHIKNILNFISILPNTNAYSGFSFSNLITGTGFFMSKDITKTLIDNYKSYDINSLNEDVLMTQCIANLGFVKYYNPKILYKWGMILNTRDVIVSDEFIYYFTDSEFKEFKFDDNILHFRIHNSSKRELDIQYFNYLLKIIYDI